jgi:hypothetical protein
MIAQIPVKPEMLNFSKDKNDIALKRGQCLED